MEAASAFLIYRRKKLNYEARIRWRRVIRRRKLAAKRQSQERLVFLFVLSMATIYVYSPIRTGWSRERSSYWWDRRIDIHIAWLAWKLQNVTCNLSVCVQWVTVIHWKIWHSNEKVYSHWTESCINSVVFGNQCWLPNYWTFIWCIQIHCLCGDKGCMRCYCSCCYQNTSSGLQVKSWKTLYKDSNTSGDFQCVSAVDGTHIPIVSPENCSADYHNRKGWHSVIM